MYKKIKIIICILLVGTIKEGYSQDHSADKIVGVWLTSGGKAKVQIYKENSRYFGKLISGDDLYEKDGRTLKKDTENPDASMRVNTVKNLVLLKNFQFKDEAWTGGTIYDPKNGSTYSCKMRLKGTKLEIRGYIGISLFGRTEIWQRSKLD
ncbi:MAG: DUF2147 domain-containing protein [Sphingobacteriaceae bacterium]|nr:DUF2147 domain-containing protein [Sphingobacteriaceae bacterium]